MIDERNAHYWHARGRELHEQGQLQAAEEAYLLALKQEPNRLLTLNNLAVLCIRQGRIEEAKKQLDKGLIEAGKLWNQSPNESLAVEWALILNARSQIAIDGNDFKEALRWSKIGLKLKPQGAGLSTHSVALGGLNRHEQAARSQKIGLARHGLDGPINSFVGKQLTTPYESAQLHTEICNLASSILRKNPLDRDAWALMIARLGMDEVVWQQPVLPWQQLWEGEQVDKLVIWDEQGFGDAIQCLRWIPNACKKANHVTLLIRPSLLKLIKERLQLPGNCNVNPRQQGGLPQEVDTSHCPLMALPVALYPAGSTLNPQPNDSLDTILKSKRSITDSGQHRAHSTLRIGLVWAAGRKKHRDSNRSAQLRCIPAETLLSHAINWAERWDLELFSLQLGEEANASETLQMRGKIKQLPKGGDWLETAEIVEQLDLVITVDTAMVHLAGSLGIPCLMLLNHICDWRWFINKKVIPWYPTLKILQAEELDSWEKQLCKAECFIENIVR